MAKRRARLMAGGASRTPNTLHVRARPSTAWGATPPNTELCSAWTWRCGPMATLARLRSRCRRWRNTCSCMGASGSVLPGSRAGWWHRVIALPVLRFRRCAGHPERANDVKLSRGGIREIEFTVQLLQVVRGGQFPELRRRPTLDALTRLSQAGLMPQETADALARAYVFLRRVEHRIQYLDDQQTHVLPTRDDDLA